MPHFYVKPENIINSKTFIIDNEQAHYVSTVRRFKTNDEIMIFDGLGNSYTGKIISSSKNRIEGLILSSSYKMPSFKLNLFTSIPKGDRFEWLIEKAGEIGILELFTINTKRSIDIPFSENKKSRYEKISISASSQCGRNDIMKIHEPLGFKEACKKAYSDKDLINILPWESEEKINISDISKNFSNFSGANIFIGPEGGFETEEIDFAKNLGFHIVTLGDNILRVETAAIAASILTLNYMDSLGKKKK